MKRLIIFSAILTLVLSQSAHADLVTARWGRGKFVTHPDTLKVEGGSKLVFDLAGLPKEARVVRARLLVSAGKGYEIACKGKDVPMVAPYYLWFDATEGVRASAADGQAVFEIKRASESRAEGASLEIAWEGKGDAVPPQVTEAKGIARPGQVLLSFKEVEDVIAGGKEGISWGEILKKTVSGCDPLRGLVPIDKDKELRYHVYVHTEPITAANLARATFLHEVLPGSGYIEEHVASGKVGEQGPTFVKEADKLQRVMLAKGQPLPAGYGFWWHTVAAATKLYYAVVTCVNGVENTKDFGPGNVVGPFDVQPQTPEPLLCAEKLTNLDRKPKKDKDGKPLTDEQGKVIEEPPAENDRIHHEQWYSWWLPDKLTPYPKRYDVVLSFCPKTMVKPAPLSFSRGHAWVNSPEFPGPGPYQSIIAATTGDDPNAFWMGLTNHQYTLKDWRQAIWRPWPQLRLDALYEWVKKSHAIDEQRVTSAIGCWGMMEIERGDRYAMLDGWGMPELTKGFQCWGRAQGAWGPREIYADRPKQENPWVRQDYSAWVREHPTQELPYFDMHTGWGAHFTEMGWPPFPRFFRAMMDTKRAFCCHGSAVGSAVGAGIIKFVRDQSLPAFGNCSVDDMPGSGDLRSPGGFSFRINAYLIWETDSLVDQAARWELDVWLDKSAPLPECTVDITPRRCQQFKAKPGQKFTYTITDTGEAPAVLTGKRIAAAKPAAKDDKAKPDDKPVAAATATAAGKVLKTGTVEADQHGLVTIVQAPITNNRCRVKIAAN